MRPFRGPTWCAGVLATVVLNGCLVFHRNPLPPGHIDVHTPPRVLSRVEVEAPDDAGEDVTWLSVGALGGWGVNLHNGHSAAAVGPEVSLHVGERHEDHQNDDMGAHPQRAWGVNLGWAPDPRTGRGPLYLEVQRTTSGLWLAPGWAWNPATAATGPQLAAGLGPLLLRANYLSHGEVALMLGLAIKGGISWVRGK